MLTLEGASLRTGRGQMKRRLPCFPRGESVGLYMTGWRVVFPSRLLTAGREEVCIQAKVEGEVSW